MGCRRLRTRDLKALAEQKLEQYDEAMIDQLVDMLTDELSNMSVEEIDEEFLTEVFYNWKNNLPDEGEWAFDEVQSDYDDYCEAKYDAWKDEQIKD